MDIQQTLSQVPLFRDMSPEYLERLSKVGRERAYAPGDTILREGERGIAFYVIASGNVEVSRSDGTVLNKLGPGASFGEMALLNDMPRQATVKAIDDVTCVGFSRLDFLDALRDQPEIAIHLLETMADLLRKAEARATQ